MGMRSLAVLLAVFGFAALAQAEEDLTFAVDDGLGIENVELTSALEPGCFDGCADARGGCSNGCCGDCCCSSRFRTYGWLDAGFMLNGSKAPSSFHGPYNQTDRHEGSLNQAYLVFERALADSPCMSVGGRVDFLYGSDAFLGESLGFERRPDGSPHWNSDHYGLAIPQAYGEVGNDTISVKFGHFYTIVGYEGVPAVNNFFYSKSLSYMFGGPFVQWGGLATWKANDCLSFDAGIVNGWDALDRVTDTASFLGRVSWGSDKDRLWTSFAIISGDELNEVATDSTGRTRFSLIAGANLTCRLQYVFHYWHATQDDFFADDQSADWYGIDQYLYYQWNPCVRIGGRFEYFHDDDGVRLGLSRPTNPNNNPFVGDMYSFSMGVNWTPYDDLMIRPEVRWDWFEGTGLPFEDGTDDSQFLVGMDAIWQF